MAPGSAHEAAGAVDLTPTSSGMQPTVQFAARVAATIFTGEAIILLAVAGLYGWKLSVSETLVPAACLAIGLLLVTLGQRAGWGLLQACVALSTVLVSLNAMAAEGEAHLAGEMLYIWPALYAAYFFHARQAATQLGFMAAAYLGVLLATAPPAAIPAAWLTLVGVTFPAAGLVRTVRDGVAQLVGRLSEAALTDTLTGLRNRLALNRELHGEIERALRAGDSLSVVIGDLDYFKSVNDRLGHRAGDEALVRVGRVLMQHRRAGDSIARTGGEEFTLLLPGASEHDAYLVSERIRAAVEREFGDDPAGLTFSFGIATYPRHGRSADSVIEAADQALYAAKALGRNRCVIFNAEISTIFAPRAGRGADEVQLATLLSLAEALDLRDTGTANHSRTVGGYCAMIATELGLAPERVKRIEVAGMLHDIGKIGVPDAILQKSGPLGTNELAEIRTHPEIGAQILGGRGLEDLREWILAHHERPDGEGYPRRLKAADIPLEARILAVADAYEAMISDRVYRLGVDEGAARTELLRCSGTQFDGRVVAAFLSALNAVDAPGSVHDVETA